MRPWLPEVALLYGEARTLGELGDLIEEVHLDPFVFQRLSELLREEAEV